MAKINKSLFSEIRPHILPENFKTPLIQTGDKYFPDFLSNALDNYSTFYRRNLVRLIDEKVPYYKTDKKDIEITRIESLSASIKKTVELFYQGQILEATKTFSDSLDKLFFNDIKNLTVIPVTKETFFRARKGGDQQMEKADLFHIKFELRHFVSTNRYSIPGFPALYLGDTTYVCWEEYNRHKLRDLWFSCFTNATELKIINIQRIEDFLIELDLTPNPDLQLSYLLRYLISFPLIIACSIKVKHPNGVFKPEYIIPQMLLQYISKNKNIDGIKFFSTKVDYTKLHGVKAYNYIFPVKTLEKEGFCSKLVELFDLTEPTSLDLEEIMYNPVIHPTFIGSGSSTDLRQIELVKGSKSYYSTTSFGKLENKLRQRNFGKVVVK